MTPKQFIALYKGKQVKPSKRFLSDNKVWANYLGEVIDSCIHTPSSIEVKTIFGHPFGAPTQGWNYTNLEPVLSVEAEHAKQSAPNRKEGFYWAKFNGSNKIEVIQFFEGLWWISGCSLPRGEEVFEWIDPGALISSW